MTSFSDISGIFNDESEKLENFIKNAIKKSELSINEIIEMYYQIMNVSSMIVMLKQQLKEDNQKRFDKIQEIEQKISRFNSQIHPKIMVQLTNAIRETTANLQSQDFEPKSKSDIEDEAKLYEELRQKMSTKEFVEQYDKGLSND